MISTNYILAQLIGWTVSGRDFTRYSEACIFAREESCGGRRVPVVARYSSGHRRTVTFFRNGYHRGILAAKEVKA